MIRKASIVPKPNLSDYGVFLLYRAREFIGFYSGQDFSMIYGRKFQGGRGPHGRVML